MGSRKNVRSPIGAGAPPLPEHPDPSPPPPTTERWAFYQWLGRSWRWLACLGALVLGLSGTHLWSRAEELGYVASYIALIAVSFLASHWYIAFTDLALALLWLTPLERWVGYSLHLRRGPARELRSVPVGALVRHVLAFLNRQFAHAGAILPWLILAASCSGDWLRLGSLALPGPYLQLPLVTFVLLLGPRLGDWLTLRLGLGSVRRVSLEHGGELYWDRRPIHYLGGALGILILLARAPGQRLVVLRIFVPLILAALVRLVRWYRISRDWDRKSEDFHRFRAAVRLWGRRLDWLTTAVAACLVFAPIVSPVRQTFADHDAWRRGARFSRACNAPERTGDLAAALFLVADSQFHELRGERVGGHLDLVDKVVPVAVRPVELNLLSGAPLGLLADTYRRLHAERPELLWAHLGDIGDLACQSELERFAAYRDRFGQDGLAALVAGNHDSTFTGNFIWHPDWNPACRPSRPLPKDASDELLLRLQGKAPGVLLRHWSSALLGGAARTALVTVRKLGEAQGVVVAGAFLDTSDFTGVNLGFAGAQGGVSAAQIGHVERALAQLQRDNPGKKLRVVVFLHHPFDELAWNSQQRVRSLGQRGEHPVVALVSAHTHLAALRTHRWKGREVPEFVIGSTTDPPEEAAIFEVRVVPGGGIGLHLLTLPVVAREDLTCGYTGTGLGAADCRGIMSQLRGEPACQDLFQDWQNTSQGPLHAMSPGEVKDAQQVPARRLLGCICRDGLCRLGGETADYEPGSHPLDDPRLYERLDQLALPPPADSPDAAFREGRRRELVCLGWAASVLQGKKKEHWEYVRALTQGFDGASALGAVEFGYVTAP